jgi:hypothetical protein
MANRDFTRRLMLMSCCASVVSLACSDDGEGGVDDDGGTGQGGQTSGAGGSGQGGQTSGAGGNTGGNGAGGSSMICGTMLVAMGSNYATDPHDLTIPLADIEAGIQKTYTTTGIGHTHNVTVTADDFAALRNGETVKYYTCFTNPGNTDHEFVLSCADPNVAPTFEGEIGTPGNCPA